MIDFQRFNDQTKTEYQKALFSAGERGCEYSYANLILWGRQRVAVLDDFFVLFSQFDRFSIYPFPVGSVTVAVAEQAEQVPVKVPVAEVVGFLLTL